MEDNTFINSHLNLIKAFDVLTCQLFFIIEQETEKIIYISPKFFDIFQEMGNTISTCHIDFLTFLEMFTNKTSSSLKEVYSKWAHFLKTYPEDERHNFIFEGTLRRKFQNKELYFTIFQTSIEEPQCKHLKYSLCSISISSLKRYEMPKIWNTKTHDIYIYNYKKHTWEIEPPIILSDTEKNILILSARGFTITDIAETINKSTETVKSSKQRIFHKFGTRNIQQAIIFAINHNMI